MRTYLAGCGGRNLSAASLANIQQEYGNGSLLSEEFAAKYYETLNAAIWAYPLATMAETLPRSAFSRGNPPHLNINSYQSDPVMANYTITAVVSPNADTLYSVAWLDLTSGPLVIGVPNMGGRFYVLEFLDAYTNVPLTIGSIPTLPACRVEQQWLRLYLKGSHDWGVCLGLEASKCCPCRHVR